MRLNEIKHVNTITSAKRGSTTTPALNLAKTSIRSRNCIIEIKLRISSKLGPIRRYINNSNLNTPSHLGTIKNKY